KLPDGSEAKGMITKETQDAIDMGLAYLAKSQSANGSFGTRQGNIGPDYQKNVAITSLAGLAVMAGGHQPHPGPHGRRGHRALEFVLASAKEHRSSGGYLLSSQQVNRFQTWAMYEHGFGTLFLAEVSGMVPDKKLKDNLKDKLHGAVQLILKAQNKEGGWRYRSEPADADVSVTICQIMALRAARNAGIDVPKSTVDLCNAYVKRCQNEDGGFRYQDQKWGNPFGPNSGFARSAAGVVALYSAGVYKGDSVTRGL